MTIYKFFRKTFWLIFLVSCAPLSTSKGDANADLITPSTNIYSTSTVPPATTATPTQQPTLTLQEREKIIIDLMSTNAGCSLPCWWGITPSVTEWKVAEKFLSEIGATVGDIEVSLGTNYHATTFEDDRLTAGDNFGFLETLGVVEQIFARGDLSGSARESKGSMSRVV